MARKHVRIYVLRPLLLVLAVLLSYGAYCLYLQATGNFHAVVAGEFYRSGQPSAADLDRYVAQHGIRSVINLRGENATNDWYQQEVGEAKKLGIAHYDFRMKASRELTVEQAQALITLMRDAPRPILVHCMHGSDRSGLASALYVAGVKHGSEVESGRQLSLLYGHIPFSFSDAYAMSRSFEHLKPMLGFEAAAP